MTDCGKISGHPFVKRSFNGDDVMLMCGVVTSSGFITAVFYPGAGADIWPCNGDTVTIERIGGFYAITGVKPQGDPSLSPGEMELFSRDKDGNKKASLLLDKNSNISLNGDSKRFVTYAELNQALQQVWAAIKSHSHPSDGSTSPGLAGVTLDISASETKTIKTGG